MKTTTTPPPQRLEQAIEAFMEDLEGLEGAVQRFEEALLELQEGALKEVALEEGAPERQNGPNLILVGQEIILSSASEPVPIETVPNEPGQTGELAAPEPPSEADVEANAKPAVPLGCRRRESSWRRSSRRPLRLPLSTTATRRKAGYAVLLLTFAVALLGTATLLAERQ